MSSISGKFVDHAVSTVQRNIASDLSSYGDDRLSVATLSDAFGSAIHGYLARIGTDGQLALLREIGGLEQAGFVPRPENDGSIAAMIADSAAISLKARMEPKFLDMCFRINEGRMLETLEEASRLVSKITNHGHGLAADLATHGKVPSDFQERIGDLHAALSGVVACGRDKELMSRLGTTVDRIVKLVDRTADLRELHRLAPDRLEDALASEIAPQVAPRGFKAA